MFWNGYLDDGFSLLVIKLRSQWLIVGESLFHICGASSNPLSLVEHHCEACMF